MTKKTIIYQLLPRLFTNYNPICQPGGTIEQNGSGKLNDITEPILEGIRQLGTTHIWLTGVIEHAHCPEYTAYGIQRDNPFVVKGQAGSPYAITDYYDIDPDLACDIPDRMGEFDRCVDRIHQAGMKVVIDFVPNHLARQYHSDAAPAEAGVFGANDDTNTTFAPDNNFYYFPGQQFHPDVYMGTGADSYTEYPAKASGNDCFTSCPVVTDWYDTVKLNYGIDYATGVRHFDPIPDTWHKMVDILLYWCGHGVDAFRCDMVHMVPVEFWHWATAKVRKLYPDVLFIAEIYEPALYESYIKHGGFDYLYDKVNLYDTLRAIQTGNASTMSLTGCWQSLGDLTPHMLNFLENHDEQRFASPQYAGDPAKVTPSLVVSSMMGTGPMMIYFGQELGEPAAESEGYSGPDGRTTIFDYWSIGTLRRWLNDGKPGTEHLTPRERWLRELYCKVLNIASSEAAIAHGKFFDLMYVNSDNATVNPHRHYIFMRSTGDETILVAANFAAESADMQINIPDHAFDFLNLPQGPVKATELLTGEKCNVDLAPGTPFSTFVPGYSAAVWKIKHPAKTRRSNSRNK